MDPKDIRTFAKSHRFVTVLTVIGFVIIAVVVFEAGVDVGFHKAQFAMGWEQSYGHDFGDPRGALGMPGADVPNGHGADGQIVSVSLPTFIVTGQDEPEKTVSISSTTIIRDGRDATTSAALMDGAYVVVIGEPAASGTVAAELIRILPPQAPPDSDSAVPPAPPAP